LLEICQQAITSSSCNIYDLGMQAAVTAYGRKECAQIDGEKCETLQALAQKSRGDWDEDKANKEKEERKKEEKKK